jgi:hypothetical protein
LDFFLFIYIIQNCSSVALQIPLWRDRTQDCCDFAIDALTTRQDIIQNIGISEMEIFYLFGPSLQTPYTLVFPQSTGYLLVLKAHSSMGVVIIPKCKKTSWFHIIHFYIVAKISSLHGLINSQRTGNRRTQSDSQTHFQNISSFVIVFYSYQLLLAVFEIHP